MTRESPPARLELGGHAPAAASIRVEHQPRRKRLARALLTLLGCWLLIPLVFFIPPHLPWVATAFALGPYLAWRYWKGVFVVDAFEGSCPSCGGPVALNSGRRIDSPEWLTCYGCHRKPKLVVDRETTA